MKTWEDLYGSEQSWIDAKPADEFSKYFAKSGSDVGRRMMVHIKKDGVPLGTPTTVDWSCDGKYFALGTTGGYVMVYDFNKIAEGTHTERQVTATPLMCDASIGREISSVRWHPNDPNLLAATGGDKVHIWNVRMVGGEADACIKVGDMRSVGCMGNVIRWHPSGEHIFVSTDTDHMILFAVKDQRKLERTACSELPYRCHDFRLNPDGEKLLAATDVGTIVAYQVVTKASGNPGIHAQHKKLSLQCHSSSIYSVATDPSGRYFATASSDSVSTFLTLDTFETIGCFARCKEEVRCVAFSYDGELACIVAKTEMFVIHSATRTLLHKHPPLPRGYSYFDVSWHTKKYMIMYCIESRNEHGMRESHHSDGPQDRCVHFWIPNAE